MYDWGHYVMAGGEDHNHAALDVLASMGWERFMGPLPYLLKHDQGKYAFQTEFGGWIYGANADSIQEAVQKIMEAENRV